jgi:hypothetical protein
LLERRHGSGCDGLDVELSGEVFGPGADDHSVVQLELTDDLLEEAATAQQRLHQRHMQVGPSHGEDDARQTGTGTHVGDRRPHGQRLVYHSAVQHVTLPQPRSFPWADHTALDPRASQQRDISLRQCEPLTEDDRGLRWGIPGVRRRGFT